MIIIAHATAAFKESTAGFIGILEKLLQQSFIAGLMPLASLPITITVGF